VGGKYVNFMCLHLPVDQNVRQHKRVYYIDADIDYSIALWERKPAIYIPLGILCLGHWGLLYRGMFIVHASWDPVNGACLVSSTDPSLLKIIFFFSQSEFYLH
jgi:hypothetical protein